MRSTLKRMKKRMKKRSDMRKKGLATC